MHWLLIGYMFLFIDRPFEVWPLLGELHVERFYMLFTMAVWLVHPGKRFLPNRQQAAYAFFAFAVLACWVLSPWSDQGQPVVEDWFKVVVFYVLLVTTVNDERALKKVVVGFVAVMGVYLLHSLREYVGGRHTYRMGIARMIGVDSTLGDPNSFGASIVFVLPFIPALWRSGVGGRRGKVLLLGFAGLCSLCILLTGSRSSLIGLLVWGVLTLIRVRRAWLWMLVAVGLSPVAFMALPESLQTRFETIVNPDVGPENAKESGEGRIEGFLKGFDLWGANPLTGVGPGAWRPATRSKVESHNLYGQLLGEMGTLGLVAFGFLVACFVTNLRRIKRVRRQEPENANEFVFQVASAVGTGLFLLLLMGNFGHNLFRFTWLWYGGFLVIANHCVTRRVPVEDDEDEVVELESATLSYEVEIPEGMRNETRVLMGE
jgi:O-antigen ligase